MTPFTAKLKKQPQTPLEKRIQTAKKRGFGSKFVSEHSCPDTGLTVIIMDTAMGQKAYGFTSRMTSTTSFERTVVSAHDILSLLAEERQKILDTQFRSKQPHTLQPGDIVCSIFEYNSRSVIFYKVVSVPLPKSVRLQKIHSLTASGDFMHGTVLPDPDRPIGEPFTAKVSMKSGEPEVQMEYKKARKWSGKEETIYSD